MASTTIPDRAPTTHTPWHRTRNALGTAATRAAQTASAARHRLRRPALVVSGLACMDASAWHTFGLGAGLLTLGASLWVFELVTGGEE